jgi:hypothetical protein
MERKQFNALVSLTSPLKNFAPLRAAMKAEHDKNAAIPFTGIFLSDLIFNHELPSTAGTGRLSFPSCLSSASDVTIPLINYCKFQNIARIISNFRAFQKRNPPNHYNLGVERVLP